jgi:two-component system, NarL family, nitrate/nitrite response regulator NarL
MVAPPLAKVLPMNPAWRGRVAIASDQPLVADVIAAALTSNGFECQLQPWPHDGQISPAELDPSTQAGPRRDVALLISDLDRVARIKSAVQLVVDVPAGWVVLTGAPRGPLWGALLDLGSVHVVAEKTGLDEITDILTAVSQGAVLTTEAERLELVSSWLAVVHEHRAVLARLATMTPREAEVLRLLYAGTPVRTIAQQLDVAEATVRTQVKRVLRKLEVRSQIGAVAAFDHVGRAGLALGDADLIATSMWLGRQAPTRVEAIR